MAPLKYKTWMEVVGSNKHIDLGHHGKNNHYINIYHTPCGKARLIHKYKTRLELDLNENINCTTLVKILQLTCQIGYRHARKCKTRIEVSQRTKRASLMWIGKNIKVKRFII